jgi:hypothetical protein
MERGAVAVSFSNGVAAAVAVMMQGITGVAADLRRRGIKLIG